MLNYSKALNTHLFRQIVDTTVAISIIVTATRVPASMMCAEPTGKIHKKSVTKFGPSTSFSYQFYATTSVGQLLFKSNILLTTRYL